MLSDYMTFLASKTSTRDATGIVPAQSLNPHLKPFQRDGLQWSLDRGRAALFWDCGLGKSLAQLEWSRQIVAATGRDVLIVAPLAVATQTAQEAAKFGIDGVTVCREPSDLRPGINITNYDRIERFDPGRFAGVVLDESSILKSFMGKTKRLLLEMFADTPYRLCCTATPAPNDHVEIGNHADFLGIMPANEMLSRWFINDTMAFGTWRLKKHAEQPFWDWVASWALTVRHPSDLGYADDGYELPPLNWHEVIVPVDRVSESGERLFRIPGTSATEIHREMRLTAPDRAAAVAALVNDSSEQWAVWCHTNQEADELTARIPDAVEVRGSDRPESKEQRLLDFKDGRIRVLVTKPSIAGFGLNFQHCRDTAFVGLSYSFEEVYQAVRRFWRFGQDRPVNAYVICAETEDQVLAAIKRKMAAHEEMFDRMNSSTSKLYRGANLELRQPEVGVPMLVPDWIKGAMA